MNYDYEMKTTINVKYIIHCLWRGLKCVIPKRWRLHIRIFIDNQKRIRQYFTSIRGCNTILLQTPTHGNLGDHAIALAEMEILNRLGITYADTPWIKDIEKRCAAVTPRSKTILIHGGGFLGSLWPNEEETFRTELTAFSGHRVIVFPQSVYFNMDTDEGKALFEESKAIYSMHPNMTLFLREQVSYDFMRKNMPEVNVMLVPDTVMALAHQLKTCKREGILLCLRGDKERTLTDEQREHLETLGTHTDTVLDHPVLLEEREGTVRDKLNQFASAELVITDRLHGMIFAAITETPCIVLNSLSHKVLGCYEWLKDLDYIRKAESVEDVPGIIEELRLVKPKYNWYKIDEAMQPLYDMLREIKQGD